MIDTMKDRAGREVLLILASFIAAAGVGAFMDYGGHFGGRVGGPTIDPVSSMSASAEPDRDSATP